MDLISEIDVSIFRAFNYFCGWNPTLDHFVAYIEILKGFFFIGTFGFLWHQDDADQKRRREILLVMLLVIALSLVINRVIAHMLPFRVRPMYAVGANRPRFDWHADLENWSSFPSDNATYLFAIAAGVWLISVRWGLFFGAFASLASLARTYFGVHYPGDILVGALIGVVTSIAVNRDMVQTRIGGRILTWEPRRPAYFYGVLFLALAEVSNGFPNTRVIAVAVAHFLTGHGK